MDVAADVVGGLDPLDRGEKILTANALAASGWAQDLIAMSERWPVRDEDLNVVGDVIPFRFNLRTTLQVESPVVEPWLLASHQRVRNRASVARLARPI